MKQFTNKIICGDAMKVVKRLPKNSVHMILTDPPYGDNIAYGKRNRTIANNRHPLLGLWVLYDCYDALKKNATAYFFLNMDHLPLIKFFIKEYTKYKIKELIIWDKMRIGMGNGFRKQYEAILVLQKGRPKYRNKGLSNIMREKRLNNTDRHVHEKPIPLLKRLIEHSSDSDHIVLDPFVGSGSTAVTCKELGRQFIGIEMEKKYVEIAKKRLQLTSKKCHSGSHK